MTAERPILMSAPMVRALLREIAAAGTGKTQTRRMLGPHNCTVLQSRVTAKSPAWRGLLLDHPAVEVRTQTTLMLAVCGRGAPHDPHLSVPFVHPDDAARGTRWEDEPRMYRVRPLNEPGDLLWVRESLSVCSEGLEWAADGTLIEERGEAFYWDLWDRHAHDEGPDAHPTTVGSIHMPRWASRITLVVTVARIERLQDISEEDAKAEGLVAQEGDGGGPGAGYKWRGTGYHGGTMTKGGGLCFHTPKSDGSPGCSCRVGGASPAQCAFRELWDRLHGAGAWARNPWVVVTIFTPLGRNVDLLARSGGQA